ncbi:MAG: DUF445 family protein [Oceanococcus sp.]
MQWIKKLKPVDANQLDMRFRIVLVLVTGVFAGLQTALAAPPAWVHAVFVVSMAGMVGYFTNFLAIRMLFQPKQGKVLGWEGLVPKNKAQIAQSLAESVQTQLLAPDIILKYLHDYQLIERVTAQLSNWLDTQLSDAEVRQLITRNLVKWLQAQGPDLLKALLDNAEALLTSMARNPDQVEQYWVSVREILEEYLKEPDNREILAQRLQRLLLEELPSIAQKIDEALEDYLRSQNTRGSIGMSVKKVFAVDDQSIAKALKTLVADDESAARIMGVMDRLADQAIAQLGYEETQAFVLEKLESWVHSTAQFSRESVLPRGIEHLQAYLDDPGNWASMEKQILSVLEAGKTMLLEFVDSQRGQRVLKQALENAVHRINVTELVEQQVMGLDTDELEAMILNNTGGNLVVIQTLGGGLGLVAGLVQVHIAFALPLLMGLAVVWLAFLLNRRKFKKSKSIPT